MDSILLESVKMKYLGNAPYILTPSMSEGSLLSYLKRERPNLTVSENVEEDIILNTRKQLLSMCLRIANAHDVSSRETICAQRSCNKKLHV